MRDYEQYDSYDFLNNPNAPNSTSPFLHPTIFNVNSSLNDLSTRSNCKFKSKIILNQIKSTV